MKTRLTFFLLLAMAPYATMAQEESPPEGEVSGTQSTAADQGASATDIIAPAGEGSSSGPVRAGDPNALFIEWGETVKVLRGTDAASRLTVENIDIGDSGLTVQGTTGEVSQLGSSVRYTPAGRPPLLCPSTGEVNVFGPCKLEEQS